MAPALLIWRWHRSKAFSPSTWERDLDLVECIENHDIGSDRSFGPILGIRITYDGWI